MNFSLVCTLTIFSPSSQLVHSGSGFNLSFCSVKTSQGDEQPIVLRTYSSMQAAGLYSGHSFKILRQCMQLTMRTCTWVLFTLVLVRVEPNPLRYVQSVQAVGVQFGAVGGEKYFLEGFRYVGGLFITC